MEGGMGGEAFGPPINYTVIIFFNRFNQVEVYFILIKFIFIRSGQIWIIFLQRVMRYDLSVEERYNISRISDTYKK